MSLLRTVIVTVVVVAPYMALALQFESITPDLTAKVGQTVALDCVADKSSSPTSIDVTWLKGSTEVQNLGIGRIRVGLSTDSTRNVSLRMTIISVIENDSGLYTCKLSSNGTTEERSVSLVVLRPTLPPSTTTGGASMDSATPSSDPRVPVMDSLRVSMSASAVLLEINGTTSVECRASKNEVRYEWLRNGKAVEALDGSSNNFSSIDVGLEHSSYVVVTSSQSMSELKFFNSQRALAGVYECRATLTSETSSATVLIQAPPVIVPTFTKDKRATLLTGQSVSFQCTVRGYPTPNVSWHHDGNPITVRPECVHPLHASNKSVDDYQPICHDNDDCRFRDCLQSLVTQTREHSGNDATVTQKLILDDLDSEMAGKYECIGTVGNATARNETSLRVHSRLRPLWPAIGIIIEIVLLVIAVLIGEAVEKKKTKKKLKNLKLEREKLMRDVGSKSPTARTNESSLLLGSGASPRKRTVSAKSETETELLA